MDPCDSVSVRDLSDPCVSVCVRAGDWSRIEKRAVTRVTRVTRVDPGLIWLVGLIGLARWIRVIPCPSVTRLIRVCPYVCVLGIGAE